MKDDRKRVWVELKYLGDVLCEHAIQKLYECRGRSPYFSDLVYHSLNLLNEYWKLLNVEFLRRLHIAYKNSIIQPPNVLREPLHRMAHDLSKRGIIATQEMDYYALFSLFINVSCYKLLLLFGVADEALESREKLYEILRDILKISG